MSKDVNDTTTPGTPLHHASQNDYSQVVVSRGARIVFCYRRTALVGTMAAAAAGTSTDPTVAQALDVLYTSYDKLIAAAEHPEQVRTALRAPASCWMVLTIGF